ncbi:MAG: Xaa-Pro peptidase family protein [Deinococcota bacterium]
MNVQKRLSNVRQTMQGEGVDLLALGPSSHMQWLLGFHPHADERPCLLLISQHEAVVLMPVLNADGSRQETDLPFVTWSDDDGPNAALQEALVKLELPAEITVALDETMRADFALLLLGALPNANHVFTESTVGLLRMRKDEAEYAELKLNAGLADKAMQAAVEAVEAGKTEEDIAEIIKESFLSNGAKPLFAIVGAAANGAFPHYHTGNTVLKHGDVLVIDLGGQKGTYSSDITRSVVIGKPPKDYANVHAVVEQAVQAAIQAAKPGAIAKTVDEAARNVITEAGYGDYFVHRTGHGLGIDIHEPPYITSSSETILEEGMVFSIEPGIYLPGRFGIRLEDIVILRKDGPEVLSNLSRDAKIIT